MMNTKLVETLIQVIHTLSSAERNLLEEKLFRETSEPSAQEIINLAVIGGSFEFLEDEPDIYTLEDGEPV
ncbi:hypothetical protein [Anabaena azotica]|uniref:hypothetical protein n=1 Tax=Anabaena azotica TaxID=197653 RepID=UPI0039A4E53E